MPAVLNVVDGSFRGNAASAAILAEVGGSASIRRSVDHFYSLFGEATDIKAFIAREVRFCPLGRRFPFNDSVSALRSLGSLSLTRL